MWGAIQKHSTSFGLLNPQNKAIGTILSISQIQQKLRKVRSTAKIAWDLNPSSQCPDLLTPKLLSRRAMPMLIRLDSFFKERKAMHLVVYKNWRIEKKKKKNWRIGV